MTSAKLPDDCPNESVDHPDPNYKGPPIETSFPIVSNHPLKIQVLSRESLNDLNFVDLQPKMSEIWDWTDRTEFATPSPMRLLVRVKQRIQRFLHGLGFPVAMVCASCGDIFNFDDDGLFIPVSVLSTWSRYVFPKQWFTDLIPFCPDCAQVPDLCDQLASLYGELGKLNI